MSVTQVRRTRPFRAMWPGCGPCETEAAARRQAQKKADESGCTIWVYNTATRRDIVKVRPKQHRCQNSKCGAALTPAEFDAHYNTFRCPYCPPRGGDA